MQEYSLEFDFFAVTLGGVGVVVGIQAVISIVAKMGWRIHQMDVKIAFLNGLLQEEVYLEQP